MKSLFRLFMLGSATGDHKIFNAAWLLFRIHTGLSIALHAGWPKMKTLSAPGWFAEQVAGLGFTFPSPGFWAGMAAWGEFIGGIMIAIGLFTRLAALQLAFQFFVIAFLWYEEPEPLTGMYFQHLLFWAFVLITFAGGGKYSLDRLIISRNKITSAVTTKTALALILVCFGMNSLAQSAVTNINDFKLLEGSWKGSLTYKDYSSNKHEIIQATCNIKIKNENIVLLSIGYPDEKGRDTKDKYRIARNGMAINDKKVIERSLLPDGTLKIVLEEKGKDGNDRKPATFHHVLMISPEKFTLTKLVKFDATRDFFQRNQYVFTR